ncbi:unnamed protein product [Ectocarpus sp. CCAP 1310/34]|nr:unnamed protein product [Ectocarpus sp. CCAP 1310/34]
MSDASGGSAASAPDAGGSPGTSTLAPGSSTQDAQQDNEVVVVPGSTSGGAPQQSVNVKRPPPVFRASGGEYDVPEATKNAVASFVVPAGFQQEGAREDSFMYSLCTE